MIGRGIVVLAGALLFLIGAAGVDVERRKADGSPILAGAIAVVGLAVAIGVLVA